MKQACSKFSALLFAVAFLVPATLLAQEQKEKEKEVKEKKDAEQIIITRKGNKDEKLVVEIVGDKILVNGKAIDESNNGDITVHRNKIKDMWAYADGFRTFSGNNFNSDNFKMFSLDSNRAMLGVTTEKADQGVEVLEITRESAASKAGLKAGDVIIKINEKKIDNPDELSAAIRAQKPGDKVVVTYVRDKKEIKTTTELGRYKGNIFTGMPAQGFKMDDLHMDEIVPRIQSNPRARTTPYGYNLTRSGGPKLGLSVQDTDDGKGVKVLEVDEESNAAKAGLKEDDVITEIDGKAVNSADEVAKIIRESKDKVSVKLKLQRSGKTQNVDVKIPRKLKTADL